MVAVLVSRFQKMVSQRSLENKHDGEVFILFKIHSYLYVIFLEYKQTVSKYLYIHIILSYKFYSCIIFSILHHMMNFQIPFDKGPKNSPRPLLRRGVVSSRPGSPERIDGALRHSEVWWRFGARGK